MRIAYVCLDPGVPAFGRKGCSLHVQEMLRAFTGLGHEVCLIASNVGGAACADLAGISVQHLPVRAAKGCAAREQACLAQNAELGRLISDGGYDLVYERYSLWSYAAMTAASSLGIPGVLEVNAPLIEEQARYRSLNDPQAAVQTSRRCFAAAHSIVAVSDAVRDYLHGYTCTRGKVTVLNNGINPARFPSTVAASHPSRPGVFTVGFVGTLKPWHGLDVLVDGFAELRSAGVRARLLIVGDGPQRDALLARLHDRGLSGDSEFTGAVAPQAIPALLASMDAAAAPYPNAGRFYFSPLKVFEYMAAALPVVASRIGQLQQVIDHGKDGLLITPGDACELGGALARLSRDRRLRLALGTAARAKVLTNWTWQHIASEVLDIAQHQALRMAGAGLG